MRWALERLGVVYIYTPIVGIDSGEEGLAIWDVEHQGFVIMQSTCSDSGSGVTV